MERACFLIEETQQRIPCLLNPESLVLRRRAGLAVRRNAAARLAGAGRKHDPVVATGGGRTELELDLLFDVDIAGASPTTHDVRTLTRPLWQLTSSGARTATTLEPRMLRFLWGKTWNLPAVVETMAERLERFAPDGNPGRSWLRMRLLEVEADAPRHARRRSAPLLARPARGLEPDSVRLLTIPGGGEEGAHAEHIGSLAETVLGDAGEWRQLAEWNDLDDPLALPAGSQLRVPAD